MNYCKTQNSPKFEQRLSCTNRYMENSSLKTENKMEEGGKKKIEMVILIMLIWDYIWYRFVSYIPI